MAIDDDIAALLAGRDKRIASLAGKVIAAVRRLRPDLEPKVRFGWGSVNFRHARAGFVCGVFPQREDVILVFENGRELDSPLLEDNGKVKKVRWIRFRPGDRVPLNDLGILLAEAIALRS
jgi:hypothetical protein